ncbi:MAG TPA: DUF1501 domain-containing protein [Alphaproteobacteria bacterium]|nr:DUF1501 domain-containing protein [Alphaproteobacteria bacterium]
MSDLLSRRAILAGMGAAGLGTILPRVSLAAAETDKRFVFIILRGAMDGLNVVIPYGDRDYARLRGGIAIAKPGEEDGAVDLDGFFGLHPVLAPVAPWFKEGALLPVHSVASPYRDRSHFDGQDLLENGTTNPRDTRSGFLNRTLALMGASDRRLGLAVGQTVPLALRGDVAVASWAPSRLPEADEGFLSLVQTVYQGDKLLSQALADGIKATESADQVLGTSKDGMGAGMGDGGRKALTVLADATGKMLADPNGPRIAVFDIGGWDTHAGQGAAKGRLANALGALSDGLVALRTALGPAWKDTVIMTATEFGRTAHVNGTGGTDHGTGTVALLAGGGITGGKVHGRWPGLSDGNLYQSRDLMPTTDLRSVIKAVLRDHLRLPGGKLDTIVFPDSAEAKPLASIVAV